jgi:hypothetical protein
MIAKVLEKTSRLSRQKEYEDSPEDIAYKIGYARSFRTVSTSY